MRRVGLKSSFGITLQIAVHEEVVEEEPPIVEVKIEPEESRVPCATIPPVPVFQRRPLAVRDAGARSFNLNSLVVSSSASRNFRPIVINVPVAKSRS